MHVLLIPKWYPGRNDPQLGDFIRKQALATSAFVRMSVLHVEALSDGSATDDHIHDADGAWELAVRYRASTSPLRPWRKCVNLVRYWRAVRHGARRVERDRGRVDLVHAYILVRPALFAWRYARRKGVPYIISEQSSEYLDGTYAGKGALFAALNKYLIRHAAGITAVSTWLGDELVRLGLCTQYTVVPNVVPGLERTLPPAGVPGSFLVVADLVDKTKNVSGVLRALAVARADSDRPHLTIIGDGPDRRMLEALVVQLGLGSCVTFLGRVPNAVVLDHMARTFAVIVNSNVETFSVVTGEALAMGRPVIATRCGGPQAFITPDNGVLIEPRDDQALAAAMLTITIQASAYSPSTIRGTVSDRFSPTAVGRAFHTVYEQALAHGR